MIADGLTMQEARASAATALTLLTWDILVEAPKGSSNSPWMFEHVEYFLAS